jgi:hypothetical protein
MQLRLKKIDEKTWICNLGTIKFYEVFENADCYFIPLEKDENEGIAFYGWNMDNTYRTEYRKMRRALIAHLEKSAKPEPTLDWVLEKQKLKDDLARANSIILEMQLKFDREQETMNKDYLYAVDRLKAERKEWKAERENLLQMNNTNNKIIQATSKIMYKYTEAEAHGSA